jgi:CRP-like cAMP-binding protein
VRSRLFAYVNGEFTMNQKADPQVVAKSVLGMEMDATECQALAAIMQVLTLGDGEVLVRDRESNPNLHLLAAGRIKAENCLEQHLCVLYEMKLGELAGTRAFVDGTPRRATLRAAGGATVYALAPTDFE